MAEEPDKKNNTGVGSGSGSGGGSTANGGTGGSTPSKWVKFGDEGDSAASQAAAVLETSVEIVQSAGLGLSTSSAKRRGSAPTTTLVQSSGPPDNLQNVELRYSPRPSPAVTLGTSQLSQNGGNTNRMNHGFSNGDVIVSVLPVNTKLPWITPASFRPELVPEELMCAGLTLTVEDYVTAMEQLTSDFRFNAYTICYKRILASWLTAAFIILLIILFSGVMGIGLFALGISWLIINAGAVFLCMFIKIKINQGLERCLARVNRILIKHKIILGLDDRGRLSCHKVHLCFIYFDVTECVKRLEEILATSDDRAQIERQLDTRDVEIVITGTQSSRRIPVKERGESLLARYSQRYAKDYLRRRLDWTVGEENPSSPRHLTSALCPCQYIEEYLRQKPTQSQNDCHEFCPCLPTRIKSTTAAGTSNIPATQVQ